MKAKQELEAWDVRALHTAGHYHEYSESYMWLPKADTQPDAELLARAAEAVSSAAAASAKPAATMIAWHMQAHVT